MKKILLGAAAVVAVAAGMSSCSKDAGKDGEKNVSAVSEGMADSISVYYGRAYGQNIWNYVNQQAQRSGEEINKEEMLKGIQLVLSSEDSNDFLLGMCVGMDMKGFIQQTGEDGVKLSKSKVLDNFKREFMADSIPSSDADYNTFTTLMNQLRMITAEQKRREQEKVAQEAGEAGAKFIAEAKASDSSIKTSESGLSYKIENPGEGNRIGANDKATVKYTGRLVDGTIFDEGTAEFAPNRVVPGFGEGMQLLGKGGKATLYIPGNLGYGPNGAGEKIGPNATLIFDIEVLEVKAAE